MRDLFGSDDCEGAIIEIGCTYGHIKEQAPKNKDFLSKALKWAGYNIPLHVGMCYWNGNYRFSDKSNFDFGIRHKRVPDYIYDELDKLICALESKKDRYVQLYLRQLNSDSTERFPSSDEIYDMITQKYNVEKLSNVRGYLSEIIGMKVIDRNLHNITGYITGINIIPPKLIIGGVENDMSEPRQVDVLVIFESGEDFSAFLRNLREDKDVELTINPSSGLF